MTKALGAQRRSDSQVRASEVSTEKVVFFHIVLQGLLGMSQGDTGESDNVTSVWSAQGYPGCINEYLCVLVAGTAPEGLGVGLGRYN